MIRLAERPGMKESDAYLERFEWFETKTRQPAWLYPLRKSGMARFAEVGFPTPRLEDWRFTNVAPIANLPFRPVLKPSMQGVDPERIANSTFGRLEAARLVFVDGHYAEELSAPGRQAPGVVVGSLAAALGGDSAVLGKNPAPWALQDASAFAALNMAFFQDGAFIVLPPGRVLDRPVHLLFISTAKETGATSHPRNVILAGAGSRATVLESYVSLEGAPAFTNVVTEMALEEGAAIEHCKFQNEGLNAFHIGAMQVRLGPDSSLVAHSIATGAKLSRNNIRVCLAGAGVQCVLNGLYLTRADQLADHHMVVEHAAPHCVSHEFFNGILEGRSKGVFHGRILVRPDAQKTDAKQTNKNLLLSEEATVDTKPQLEIYADDVKCTHGATVGQLSEESIFYLRSRGLAPETARRMLIHAFAGEIVERIRHKPAREELDRLIWDRLEANPHVAEKK
jgi:Fe-S cluster assembly protein SufD